MVSSMKAAAYKKIKQSPMHNPIIRAEFPIYEDVRQLPVFKFNRFLSCVLGISILISVVSYSMVIAKENAIIAYHNKANDVNYDNIELQNKVDYARSFYNVNEKISKISFLKKPDKVIEVKAITPNPVVVKSDKVEVQPISGY
ncbi:MAG: hypothetical protein PHC34_08790 [Candidatus Gastranaerophilales bacterium]|nr:hypothetical protein [Candidatus Gastranaerophilales bacterium]